MSYIDNILFAILTIAGISLFVFNFRKLRRNILLGRDTDRTDRRPARWRTMVRVALGQSKMVTKPLPGILHIFVYIGFVIINIEVIEIIIDGISGTHRILSFLGPLYSFLIASFEILAVLVFFGCFVFFTRRNIVHVKRLVMKELDGWPRTDANAILLTEMFLMAAFITMNAADFRLSVLGIGHYAEAGISPAAFPVSGWMAGLFTESSSTSLIYLERICWWAHIAGIFAFLNYLPYSKHLHILFSFPNTFYSNLWPKGRFTNAENVTTEVKAMLDPSFTPPPPPETPQRFGAKDVQDLTWKQLLDAYSCTECGRCTAACPANITGKKLSPRKIMMDTRDRLEEVGKIIDKKGKYEEDGKSLLNDYIKPEELWACTTCNACVEECPVNIDPLSIIMDLRRYLVMEQSAAPAELNMMMTNVENNAAPWQFSPMD
ncbi:MAG TPA: (Fe-S)-binding protein, partial [Bacteroidia bacterium]|nr:(Fe-S)-binding protein [Bacteroidia bacterium]